MVRSALPVVRHATVSLPCGDVLAAARSMGGELWSWSAPAHGEHWAAFGQSAVLTTETVANAAELTDRLAAEIPCDPEPPPGPWLASVAFDARRLWSGWPVGRFVLPKGIFWARDGRYHATALSTEADGAGLNATLAEMTRAALGPRLQRNATQVAIDGALDANARRQWGTLLDRCLERIDAGSVSKVVAARRIPLSLTHAVDPVALMARLEERYPACQSFLFSGAGDEVFVGATPETLCRIDGADAAVDALAGSAPLENAESLLRRDKERTEHAYVLDAVLDGLGPLCVRLEYPESPMVVRLPNIAHLHTPVRARLKSGVGPGAVMAALHPTPAVAGTPRIAAMDLLLAHEDFARGMYSGAVGLVGDGKAHLCVALRCARIQGTQAELFVGAGVVTGSKAELEWEETTRKSLPMRQALQEAMHDAR